MSTEAIDRSKRHAGSAEDITERAQKAVKVFRQMQFGLSSYAKAVTGRRSVRVEVSSGPPRTDGDVIYYRPPIALGDNTPHDRNLCDKRGEDGLHTCPACRVREEVLVNIYHEIAHIAFGTFDAVTEDAKIRAVELALKETGRQLSIGQIRSRSYMELASQINPYLPVIVNALEDSRVDSSMFEARRGTKKMLTADTFSLLRNGVPDANGELHEYRDSPLNSQVTVACYLDAAGYQGWQEFFHDKVVKDIADPALQRLIEQVRAARSAADTYALAYPVLARLRELGYFGGQDKEQNEASQDGSADNSDAEQAEESDRTDDSRGDDGSPRQEESFDPRSDEGSDSPSGDSDDAGEQESDSGETGDRSEGGPGESEGEPNHQDDNGGASEGTEGKSHEAGSGGAAGAADEASSAPEAGDQQPEGEVDAARDEVPEQPGGGSSPECDGGDHRGTGDGHEALDAPEGADDEADSASEDGSSGGDQQEGDRRGAGVPEPAASSQDGDEAGEPDDGSQARGRGDQAGEDSSSVHGDGNDESESGDPVHDESGSDSELIDTGADEGKGGVKVPEYGTVEDAERARESIHEVHELHEQHDDAGSIEEAMQAIAVAVMQGLYFETPSTGVTDVQEFHYDPSNPGWEDVRFISRERQEAAGIICDVAIPEWILGPALLKTRRIFSDNKNASYQPNLRSGRVNAKVLGRRAWKGDDDRLFGKKRIPAKKDYAVMIGIDISSSNLGVNLALVKRAAFAQAELCARTGIPFEIIAHSAGRDEDGFVMRIHHVKSFDEPWNPEVQNRLATLAAIGGNLDGHALEFLRKRLASQPATDKILLYYTDGKMPAANKEEELVVLQRQIKLCKRDNMTLLGVGIRTDSPVRHGLDTVQVDDDDDLQRVVEHLGKRLARSAR